MGVRGKKHKDMKASMYAAMTTHRHVLTSSLPQTSNKLSEKQ